MPFVFSHVEYCDMHFVYGFCNGNAHAAVEEYQRHFPDRKIPSRGVFTRINQTLRDTGCLPSVAVRSEREVVRTMYVAVIESNSENKKILLHRRCNYCVHIDYKLKRAYMEQVHCIYLFITGSLFVWTFCKTLLVLSKGVRTALI